MAKKPAVAAKDKDKEQIERFKKIAKELGVDESGQEFERVFKEVVKIAEKKPSRH